MPRHRETKKDRKLALSERMVINDVKLSDFANASMSNPSAHPKKGVFNVHLDSNKISKVSNLGKEDLSWFEKDLDDFEIKTETTEGETEDNVEIEVAQQTPRKNRKSRKGKQIQLREKDGIDYPVDLWYQLSYYIYPETVSVFARLCKSTSRIVSTNSFWRNLYTRFYISKIKLPKKLQPVCIERIHGLKANVVRALYHFYPPFIERLTQTVPFESEPHSLVGQRCLLLWYQPVKNYWNFCFKFVKPGFLHQGKNTLTSQRDIIDHYDDLSYNTEAGCTILQVTCTHFLSVPIVMGMVLNRVFLTVSGQGMRYHTLRLMFDSRYQHQSMNSGTALVLDPVINVRVIPWWDPKYPFTT
ncbi:putative transmembrane protein 183BP isoform X1 [Patella vulgata]|uniref:putative transmembrane protein 183BP isoform X1 n=1 Tax=Patella vulgata TaxID=6465 RepID=UPI00217F72D3|nr:putative transmembrane protein 183BP isoform X1 [Patella vulgata]